MRRVWMVLVATGLISGCLETRNVTERPDAAQNAASIASYQACQRATVWRNRDGRCLPNSEYDQMLREATWEADLAWKRRNLEPGAYQQEVLGRPLNSGVAPVFSKIYCKPKAKTPPANQGGGWY